jgi:predicted acyl esterase
MEEFMAYKKQISENMQIEFNLTITVNDGTKLSANIFRPIAEGKYPVILSHGIYAKDLYFPDNYPDQWRRIIDKFPETRVGTSNRHSCWEVIDPEKWVPHGYAVMRVDSRGAGGSEGYMDPYQARETQDMYEVIEWAASQPWCNGKVGVTGISYFICSGYNVAELNPPHLAAFAAWEGNSDYYRDNMRQGGILATGQIRWMEKQVRSIQHGKGIYGYKSLATGMNVSGDETLSDQDLARNRADHYGEMVKHEMRDEWWQKHNANDLSKIKAPMLVAGNWGGNGLHLRGSVEGYLQAASREKYFEMHGEEHWSTFMSPYGFSTIKQFFDHYLKGEDSGWLKRKSKIQLWIRHPGDKYVERWENEFPLARTKYTEYYLNPDDLSLSTAPYSGPAKTLTYRGFSDGLTFLSKPLAEETEITGYLWSKLAVSSSTIDADMFLVFRVFRPDFTEVVFRGANDPYTPAAQGWLRASHRKIDPAKSTPYRPWHTHDEKEPLEPGKVYDLDIEIWPTCIVVPKGYYIGLTVRGKDYLHPCNEAKQKEMMFEGRDPLLGWKGGIIHDHPFDRPPEIFDGDVTLHFGPKQQNFVRVPVIPEKE